jgi:biopolymer transport protein ExbB/TolQ
VDFLTLGIGLAKLVLVFYSVVSVAGMVERGIVLRRLRRAEAESFGKLRAIAAKNDRASAHAVASASVAPSAKALLAGLSQPGMALREAVGREVTLQTAALQKNLPYLATIASTAPYVGLFGTVLGILGAFQKIAATGQTGPAVVSGSISEALITTALGLGVAIPAAVAYNLFLAQVNQLSLEVENHALELAERLDTQGEAP